MTSSTPSSLPGLIDNDLIPNVRQLSSPDEDVDDHRGRIPTETGRVCSVPTEDGTTAAHRTSPNNSYRGDQVPPVDRILRLPRKPSSKTKKKSVVTVRVANMRVRERHIIDMRVQKRDSTDTRVRERDSIGTRVREHDSTDTRVRERDSTDTRVRERDSTDTRVRERDSTDTRIRASSVTDTRLAEEFRKLENTKWFASAKRLSLKEKYVDEAVRRQMLTGEPFSGPVSFMQAVLEVEHEEFGGTLEETESPNSTDQPIAGCSRRESKKKKPHSAAEATETTSTGCSRRESKKKKPHSAAEATETTSSSLTAMLQEEAELTEDTQCIICLIEEMSVVFLPCGHFCCCSICAPSLHHCPECRTRIITVVRVNSM